MVALVTLPATASTARPLTTHPAAAASLPAYVVAIMGDGSFLRVYKTSTGAVVAMLKAPAGLPFLQLASGGTRDTFLTAAGTDAATPSGCNTSYYRFRLSATGRRS